MKTKKMQDLQKAITKLTDYINTGTGCDGVPPQLDMMALAEVLGFAEAALEDGGTLDAAIAAANQAKAELESAKRELLTAFSIPDREGEWRVVIDATDNQGRTLRNAIHISDEVMRDAGGGKYQEAAVQMVGDRVTEIAITLLAKLVGAR